MADDLLSQIRVNGAVPRHVAVIMDGNGRWARERSLPRPLGHRAGMKAVPEAAPFTAADEEVVENLIARLRRMAVRWRFFPPCPRRISTRMPALFRP